MAFPLALAALATATPLVYATVGRLAVNGNILIGRVIPRLYSFGSRLADILSVNIMPNMFGAVKVIRNSSRIVILQYDKQEYSIKLLRSGDVTIRNVLGKYHHVPGELAKGLYRKLEARHCW